MTNQKVFSESHALATLVQLQKRAREAQGAAELYYILVNETHNLAPYRQAALWLSEGSLASLSGVVAPEANAPYVQWLTRIFRQAHKAGLPTHPRLLLPENLTAVDAEQWHLWLPAAALLLPLPAVGQHFTGGILLLVRDHPWTPEETALLGEWVAAWAHCRALINRNRPWLPLRRLVSRSPTLTDSTDSKPARFRFSFRQWRLLLFLPLLALMLLPVRLTVLAPGELIPLQPSLIRAPLDGVIEQVLVVPNQRVLSSEPLFSFDRVTIHNRLQIAIGALNTVRVEYRQWAQQSLVDPGHKHRLAVLQGQIAEKEIEVAYLEELYERGVVTAPRDGIVLFDDPQEWTGRPVVTGERVMMIADERQAELEVWLAPGDAIPLDIGSRVNFYLNTDPLNPIAASLRYQAYEAVERPDGQYAYRVRASINQDDLRQIRIGLKGTARLEGKKVTVAYWILRRPLAALRTWLGI